MKKILDIKNKILLRIYKFLFLIMTKLPRNKKIVIFESFHGKQFSDSPRAIYEYMSENYPGYKLYWSADRRYINLFEEYDIKHVRRLSVKWLYLMGTAKYWIVNSRLPLWLPKPKNTVYVQTWHGTPLKKLGIDIEEVLMPGTDTESYKRNFVYESGKWDYLVSPNDYSTKIFKRAFQFNGEIIESGYPRNDFLINSNDGHTAMELKKSLGLASDKKIILYAPTWRDNQFYSKGKYKFELEMDLHKMKSEMADDYIVLLRLHYLVAENIDLSGLEGFVFDMSSHRDIRDLYLIADILITDYSSVFFDYANLKRPMIFFAYDIEDYRDNLRGFYFEFEKEAPGPIVKTTEELIQAVRDTEYLMKKDQFAEAFFNKFCYLETGESSKKVVERIFK